jgi:U11/U12 small nuclear ribonucleoprotein SNRNP48
MEEIKQAGGIGCLVEGHADITPNVLKSDSHGSTHQGSYDFSSSSSHDKVALGSRSSGCHKSPRSDYSGRFSSRNRYTRDSYKTSRYETHGKRYLSENKNKWIVGSESEMDQSYPYQQENHRCQRSSNDNRNYDGYKKGVSDNCPESIDCSARSQRSSVTEYARMSGEGCGDQSRASKRHRSVSVTQDQFSDRYDPQNTYSDGNPATGMLDDAIEEAHHRRHHERKHDHHH